MGIRCRVHNPLRRRGCWDRAQKPGSAGRATRAHRNAFQLLFENNLNFRQMILVYKFDFVFIQNIKISLINLSCEGDYRPERRHILHTKYASDVWHWRQMVSCSCT